MTQELFGRRRSPARVEPVAPTRPLGRATAGRNRSSSGPVLYKTVPPKACRSLCRKLPGHSVADMSKRSGIQSKGTPGRPGKGARDAILARPHVSIGDTIRERALEERLTNGEYMVKLAAIELELPEYIPVPMMRTVKAIDPIVKDDHYSFTVRPPLPFGKLLKQRAKIADLSYGDYMVMLAARALEMTEHAPQAADQLDLVKEAALTAA